MIEAEYENTVSSGPDSPEKKTWNMLEKLIIDLSKPLGEKLPQPFSHQNVLISLIPSQLSKSYISAAELVQDYIFFPGLAIQWIIKVYF